MRLSCAEPGAGSAGAGPERDLLRQAGRQRDPESAGGLTSLGQKLQDSFVTSKEDVYRDLADLLVQAGGSVRHSRSSIAEAEELSQFTLRENAPDRRLSLLQLTAREVTWTRHGDDIARDLASLIREEQDLIIRSPRSKEDDARLEALRQLLVEANDRFRSWLDDLVDELG